MLSSQWKKVIGNELHFGIVRCATNKSSAFSIESKKVGPYNNRLEARLPFVKYSPWGNRKGQKMETSFAYTLNRPLRNQSATIDSGHNEFSADFQPVSK